MKYLFNILLLLSSIAGFSQFKISGYVTDANNQKLSGVIVHIEENNSETTTDENGFYQFSSLPKGTNRVIFHLYILAFAYPNLIVMSLSFSFKSFLKLFIIFKIFP